MHVLYQAMCGLWVIFVHYSAGSHVLPLLHIIFKIRYLCYDICYTLYIAFLEYQIPNYANLIIMKPFQFHCACLYGFQLKLSPFLCKRHFSFAFCDISLYFAYNIIILTTTKKLFGNFLIPSLLHKEYLNISILIFKETFLMI